jgi:hypothetical protein
MLATPANLLAGIYRCVLAGKGKDMLTTVSSQQSAGTGYAESEEGKCHHYLCQHIAIQKRIIPLFN